MSQNGEDDNEQMAKIAADKANLTKTLVCQIFLAFLAAAVIYFLTLLQNPQLKPRDDLLSVDAPGVEAPKDLEP